MSRTIEVSDQDYARIQHAADAAGMPVDAWVVTKAAPGRDAKEPAPPLRPDGQPARTMADLLAGRIGRFNSGTGQPSSSNVSESFAEHVEEKQRKGRL